jgi:hypothetical protein
MKTDPIKKLPPGCSVADGKYIVQCDGDGRMRALRYGEPWRDLTGDGMVLALVQEIERLRKDYYELIYEVATVHEGETRHQTAKRYIHERENRAPSVAQETPDTSPGDDAIVS